MSFLNSFLGWNNLEGNGGRVLSTMFIESLIEEETLEKDELVCTLFSSLAFELTFSKLGSFWDKETSSFLIKILPLLKVIALTFAWLSRAEVFLSLLF